MLDPNKNSTIISASFESIRELLVVFLICDIIIVLLFFKFGLLPALACLIFLFLVLLFLTDTKYFLFFFPFFVGVPLSLFSSFTERTNLTQGISLGHGVNLLNIILLIGLGVIFTRAALLDKNFSFSIPKKKIIFTFFLCVILSIVGTQNLSLSLFTMAKLIIVLTISYTLIYNLLKNEKSLESLYYAVILAGVISALYGILQNYLLTGKVLRAGARIFGSAGGGYGSFIGISLSFALAVILYERSNIKIKWLCVFSLPFLCLALVLSQTRAWILGSIAACLLLLYHSYKRFKFRHKIITICCLILLLTAFANQFRNIGSFLFVRGSRNIVPKNLSLDLVDLSLVERLYFWNVGWNLFLKNPLTGMGIGNVRFLGKKWTPIDTNETTGDEAGYIDNHYLGILAETGIIGLIGWILLIGTILKSARNISKNIIDFKQRIFLNGISGGLIVLFIGGLFWNLTSGTIDSSRLFLLAAMLFSMENNLMWQQKTKD
jgi:putative inorganic carbon (HCO3(-)) transporter